VALADPALLHPALEQRGEALHGVVREGVRSRVLAMCQPASDERLHLFEVLPPVVFNRRAAAELVHPWPRLRGGVEARDERRQPLDVEHACPLAGDQRVEHPVRREAAHLDGVLHCFARSFEAQRIRPFGDGRHPQVDVRRESLVQPQLLLAIEAAALHWSNRGSRS
jgi:hypothetical protein